MRAIAAFALVAFLHQAAPPQPQPTPQPGTAIVSGQVLDATTKRPVGGVSVMLAKGTPLGVLDSGNQVVPTAQGRTGVAVTNAQGRFVFRDVPAGEFWLNAQAEGYAPGASGRKRIGGAGMSFTVKDGARIIDANLQIWKFASISGIVRDDRGEPIVGVPVWAMRRSLTGGQLSLSLSYGHGGSTDDRGMYRIDSLMPGSYVLAIRLSTHTVPIATSDAYRAAVASGTTATITRSWMETGAIGIEGGGIVVDDFQVRVPIGQPPVLPGPNKTLLIHPPLFYPSASVVADATTLELSAGDDRSGLDFRMPLVTGMRVSGILSGPDGPMANAGLRLLPSPSNQIAIDVPVAYATTDARGRFAFLGVPNGSYIVRAYRVTPLLPMGRPAPPAAGAPPTGSIERPAPPTPAPSIFGETQVTVGSSNVDGLSVVMQLGARLMGRLMFDGTPPSAAQIQRIQLTVRPLVGLSPSQPILVQIDGEGRLTSPGLAPGRYLITAGSMPAANTPGVLWALASARIGSVDGAHEAFTVGTDDIGDVVVTLTEKSIALAGTVRTGDGAASSDATIVVFPADTQAWIASGMSSQRVLTGAPNASGAYDLRVRFPGDYLVVAIPPDVTPDIDPAFIKRWSPSAVRVTLALGDARTQPLTIARAR